MRFTAHIVSFVVMTNFFCLRGQTTLAQDSINTTAQKVSEPSKRLPDVLIFPWQTPGVDPDSLRQTREARDAVVEKIKQSVSPNAQRLEALFDKQKVPAALKDDIQNVWAEPNYNLTSPLIIMPLWTHVHDQELFGILVINGLQNSIQSFNTKFISKSLLKDAFKSKTLDTLFTTQFQTLLDGVKKDPKPNTDEDVAILFKEQASSRRPDEIDRTTLNTLIGSYFATKDKNFYFTLINPFATGLLKSIHGIYGLSNATRKPNRIISTRVTYDKKSKDMKLPLKLQVGITTIDGVFGKTLPPTWEEELILDAKQNGDVALSISQRLNGFIDEEKKALKRDELPSISSVRGAWAYVDKGRAWGLQMNDRLVIADGSKTIAGHVVGYYGPEMKLKSPRGYSIHEGAIIFIRKGQKNLKVGQTLSYDQKQVPSF